MTAPIADVLIPLALDQAYSYAVPPELTLAEGDVVQVPLGPRETVGVVWSLRDGAGSNLRRVTGRIGVEPLSPALRRLVEWIARYTLAPKGSALAMALRLPEESRTETAKVGVRATGMPPSRMTPARGKVVAVAADKAVRGKRALALEAGVSAGVIDGLIDDGVLETVALAPERVAEPPDPDHPHDPLSEPQAAAARALIATLTAPPAGGGGAGEGGVTLLEGVTGSGKTEVYFEVVAEALRRGVQSLVLMPEIALTAQFLDRFAKRFGVRPAAWHSGVGGRRREKIRAGVASGEVQVVVGARSALFLPFRQLGLIVVDEEHEGAYKQDDGVCYHARDMAVVRGKLENAAVVLASATPAIETRVNAERGRYRRVVMPERFGGRRLPEIRAIDMRGEKVPRGRYLSPSLVSAIAETNARGEQALLFLNRRGYAPLTLCRACGHRYQCPNCSTWLVEHRFRRALVCHHCGHAERRPEACTECGTFDNLTACGPGVERIAEEVSATFPDKRVIVLSSDFPGGAERLRAELQTVAEGGCDIVVGTQLVAKGTTSRTSPSSACSMPISADLRRSPRRRAHLPAAPAGDGPRRARREAGPGPGPDLPARAPGDLGAHLRRRRTLLCRGDGRPRGRGPAALRAPRGAGDLLHRPGGGGSPWSRARPRRRAAPRRDGARPAEAPLALVRGRYRFRLLVKTEREIDLQSYLRDWLAGGRR